MIIGDILNNLISSTMVLKFIILVMNDKQHANRCNKLHAKTIIPVCSLFSGIFSNLFSANDRYVYQIYLQV